MEKIRLPRDGAEYAHFTFSPPLSGDEVLEVQVGGTWYPMDMNGGSPRLLLRGPNTSSGSLGVLVNADGPLRVRIKTTPEVIVRGAGYVALVS